MSGFNQTESKPLLVIFHLSIKKLGSTKKKRNWEVQAYFGDTVGLFPGHRKKASITIKLIVIFLVAEGLNL